MNVLESITRRIERAEAMEPAAERFRAKVRPALVEPRWVDDLLGGAWLGHRFHPVAVQLPMGAWLMATLLDLADSERHAAAVDTLLLTGCITALPAAVTGAHDLATTSGRATRVGLVHAGTVDVALVLFATALVKHRRGDRRKARRLALAGAAVAGAGAYLGGHLAYRLGVGVDD